MIIDRDLITQNMFREVKDPKHPHRYCFLVLKRPTVERFCCLPIRISCTWQGYSLWPRFYSRSFRVIND